MYKSAPNAPFKPPRPIKQDISRDSSIANINGVKRKITNSSSQRIDNGKNRNYRDSDPEDKENGNDGYIEESDSCKADITSAKRIKFKKFSPPKQMINKKATPETEETKETNAELKSYAVQWRKKTNKKNKTWEGDGILLLDDNYLILKNENNKILYKLNQPKKNIIENEIICMGNYEVEKDIEINHLESLIERSQTPIIELKKNQSPSGFKIPMMEFKPPSRKSNPLYNIDDTSLVLEPPRDYSNDEVVDVIVDPSLSSILRPHQKEGVKFLYECVMGFRPFDGYGALLADEMGLGKTLMTITLIWTLYKQNPFLSSKDSVVKKTLICCPVTLIDNWKKEFKKWLGVNKFSCLALNQKQSPQKDKQDIINFGKYKVHQVLIMGYEKTHTCSAELATVGFDLLICDEGHKIKNPTNKTLKILTQLAIQRKILLTGTPIQNDLSEFFTIINFINPGILGSFQLFQKNFIRPISLSREVNCSNPEVKKLGNEKSNELIKLTSEFILRRTSSILSKFLTDKTDLILFVPPTDLQIQLFRIVMGSERFILMIDDYKNNQALSLITILKKICNSPSLLADDKTFKSLIEEKDEIHFQSLSKKLVSGKIKVLIPLLLEINNLNEKVVIISNYTQTLNLLETILNKLNLSFLRLDGAVPNNLRSKLVHEFNTKESAKIFLLSSKSGGMGINLAGASRLILFDNDWNPSTDLQSMARIHRDGQVNPVFIYRLMTVGCIDEKIFQRQLMKNSLSRNFLDNDIDSDSNVFDSNDLKNLFEIVSDTICNTHDLLECNCEGKGEKIGSSRKLADSDIISEDINATQSTGWVSALDIKNNSNNLNEIAKTVINNELLDYMHFNLIKNKSSFSGDKVIERVLKSSDESLINFLMVKFTPSQPIDNTSLETNQDN